jgi:hypothetical protein
VPKNFIEYGKGAHHAELCAVVLRCSYCRGTVQHVCRWSHHRAWHGVEPPTWTSTSSCSAGLVVVPTELGYRFGWLASLSDVTRLAALAAEVCGQRHSVVAADRPVDAWDTRGVGYPHRPKLTAVDSIRESAVNGQPRRLASLPSNLIRAGGSHD